MIKIQKFHATLLLGAFFMLPATAHASFWKECKVIVPGNITPNEDGFYKITPISHAVTNGHVKEGEPCFDDKLANYPLSVKIDGQKPEGQKTIALIYQFYNGMGSDGVVNEETWAFENKTTFEKVKKWLVQ